MGDVFKGDERAPSAQESTQRILQSLTQYLPGLTQAYDQTLLPTARAELGAAQATSPQLAQLQNEIGRQNALYSAGTDLGVLQGPGRALVNQGLALQQSVDPEYYQTRALAGQKIGDLLNSINLNGLSGSERAEVERSVNRSNQNNGSADVGSNIKTVENAAQFGSALQNKRNALGQAIQQATQFLPTSKSGVDVFQQATGRPSTSAGPQSTQGSQAGMGLTQGLLGAASQAQNTGTNVNANRRTVFDAVNQSYGASGLGNCASCWIFKVKYHKDVPYWVRYARDFFYQQDPKIRIGYVRTGKVIIPLMRKYSWFMKFVDKYMLQPLVNYGGWMYSVPGYKDGKRFQNYKIFWINFWRIIGRI